MGDITRVEKVFQLVEKSALSDEAKQSFALRRLQLMEEYSPSLIKLVIINYHSSLQSLLLQKLKSRSYDDVI